MIGIYKITSPSGKVYIGQSIDIERRFYLYKILRCKSQIKLYNSLKKYGVEKHIFEVIIECKVHQLNDLERYYQELYNVLESGLNCILTKSSDRSGKHSEETKFKISEKAKVRKASEETKIKMSKVHKGNKYNLGRKLTEEVKNKISASMKGIKCPQRAVKYTDEMRLKQSVRQKGIKRSEETKKKISEKLIGNKRGCNKIMSEYEKNNLKNLFSKVILDTETGIFYIGTREASQYKCINQSTLRSRLNGALKNNTTLIYC